TLQVGLVSGGGGLLLTLFGPVAGRRQGGVQLPQLPVVPQADAQRRRRRQGQHADADQGRRRRPPPRPVEDTPDGPDRSHPPRLPAAPAFQLLGQLFRRGVAPLWVLIETLQADQLQPRIDLRVARPRRLRRRGRDVEQYLNRVIALEGRVS